MIYFIRNKPVNSFCSFKTFSFSILEITEIMHDRCKVFKEKLN